MRSVWSCVVWEMVVGKIFAAIHVRMYDGVQRTSLSGLVCTHGIFCVFGGCATCLCWVWRLLGRGNIVWSVNNTVWRLLKEPLEGLSGYYP